MTRGRTALKQHYPTKLQYIVLCLALVVFLSGVYIVSTIHGGHRGAASQPVDSAAPVFPCASPDMSFCSTERAFRGYVAAADFSEVLEHQNMTLAQCGISAPPRYCMGVQPGVPIRLLAVDEYGMQRLLMRNDYIAYFRAYFAAHGPFRFITAWPVAGGMRMQFLGKDGAQYVLQFQQAIGTWQFTAPTTSGA